MTFNPDEPKEHINRCIGLMIKRGAPLSELVSAVADTRWAALPMPCGFAFKLVNVPMIPKVSVYCPCGDKSHILIEVVE